MNKYELMYIIDTAVEDAPRKELIEKVSAQIVENGGEVEKVDEWGKRRLAYAINYKTEGYYVLVNFSAESAVPKEMERLLQINEQVLRYLVIRLEEKHTSVKPRAIPVRPAAPIVEEAPVVEEAAPTSAEEAAPATEA